MVLEERHLDAIVSLVRYQIVLANHDITIGSCRSRTIKGHRVCEFYLGGGESSTHEVHVVLWQLVCRWLLSCGQK